MYRILISTRFLSLLRFHQRRLWQNEPRLFAALLVSLTVCIVSTLAYWEQRERARTAWNELQSIGRAPAATVPASSKSIGAADLPPFQASKLLERLHRAAEVSALSLDDISLTLDDSAGQPYLRYHASLTLSGSYAPIRTFIEQVLADAANSSLDGIRCTRDDIAATQLNCAITLSAYYRRNAHA